MLKREAKTIQHLVARLDHEVQTPEGQLVINTLRTIVQHYLEDLENDNA